VSDVNATLPEVEVTAQRDAPAPQRRQPPRLTHKRLNVTFIKGSGGKFAESSTDTVKLSGLRASAYVTKVGGASMNSLDLRIWGMTLSKMNDLSTMGLTIALGNPQVLNNQVILEAGDDDAGMTVVHHGTIFNAWVDPQGMPDVAFHLSSHAGLQEAVKPVAPTGFRGLVDVSTIMSSIADLANWNFRNDGVTTKLEDVYYPGTAWEQMQAVADHANINATRSDGTPKTLIIWPKGGSIGGAIPLINKDTGMIGYPTYTRQGIIVTTRFNPAIGTYGQKIKVETDLKSANPSGIWSITSLTHTLDAEVPGGNWQTRFEAVPAPSAAEATQVTAPP